MKSTDMENNVDVCFSLKYGKSDSTHKKGELVVVRSGELRIGQQEDCEVRFTNRTDFEDEQYAVIRPTHNEGEWQIIPVSEYVDVYVNGVPVILLHHLNDGDRISFDCEDQELVFKICRFDASDTAKGVVVVPAPHFAKSFALLTALTLVLLSLLGGYVFKVGSAERNTNRMLNALRESVLQVSVDSVIFVERTSDGEKVLRTFSYLEEEGAVINGTAFLTSDSRIVTARHCIEPWLNDLNVADAGMPEDLACRPSRWAMEAETYNQTHESDTSYAVVAICNFSGGRNGSGESVRSHRSSDFFVDRTRDLIVEKGDFKNVFYWRSIEESGLSKEMMLGDVAWARTDIAGQLALAGEDTVDELLTGRQHFYFIGYPDHKTMRGLNVTEGHMQMEFEKGGMIAHDGNLIHGYSGAPAIVLKGQKAYVVGIVTRIDANGGGRSYSVPVNELIKEEEIW